MTQRVGTHPGTDLRRPSRDAIPLLLPPNAGLRVSPRAFWRICQLNRDLRLERTATGKLVVMAPAGSESGGLNARLTTRLGIWAEADATGEYFDSSAGFTLPNGAVRAPDASWIRKERWNALTPEQKKKFAPICPDFVVELCSPSDDKEDVRAKMREYIAQGARLGWMLDPRDGTAEIYRPGQPVEVRSNPATLSGEDVLVGLTIELKGILFA